MGLVDYISRQLHQKAFNISTYDEQLIVAKLDAIMQRKTFFAKYKKLRAANNAYKIGREKLKFQQHIMQ